MNHEEAFQMAVAPAIQAYKDNTDLSQLLSEFNTDEHIAAMLVADLISAYPAVENAWKGWSA